MLMTILGFIIQAIILIFFIIVPLFIYLGFFIEIIEHNKKVKRIEKNCKDFWGNQD